MKTRVVSAWDSAVAVSRRAAQPRPRPQFSHYVALAGNRPYETLKSIGRT